MSVCMYVCNGGPDVSRHAGKTKSGYAAWRAGENGGWDGGWEKEGGIGSLKVTPGPASGIQAGVFWFGSASLACLLAGRGWMAIYDGSRHGVGWKCRILQDLSALLHSTSCGSSSSGKTI